MALGFSSYQRLERILLKTRNILGETDDTFRENNKSQALQYAASFYSLYDGDGSETTYTDSTSLTILQSELIATVAAIELISSAISYYKEDVIDASGGPASASFRSDKLDWLKSQLELLEAKKEDLESGLGILTAEDENAFEGVGLAKSRACNDPVDDVCCDEDYFTSLEGGE